MRIASIVVQDATPRQHITGIAEISIVFCACLARCIAREGQGQTLSQPINRIHFRAQSGDLPGFSLRFTIHIEEAIIDSEYNSCPRLERTEPEEVPDEDLVLLNEFTGCTLHKICSTTDLALI